jgi:hypothetical protein
LATPIVSRRSVMPQAVLCPKKPGPYQVPFDNRKTVTRNAGEAAVALADEAERTSSTRKASLPARLARQVTANVPPWATVA